MTTITKRKTLAIAGVLGLAGLVFGAGTLAYFNDKDTATNTFTSGKVDITLKETDANGRPFVQDQTLLPGTNRVNAIAKNATVTVEDGSEDSWVWVEVLIPSELYESKTETAEHNNALHYNQFINYLQGYEGQTSSIAAEVGTSAYYDNPDHQWSLMTYIDEVTVDGVSYSRLRTTHKDKVAAGETTSPAVNQFYMDDSVYYNNKTGKYMIPADGNASGTPTDFVPYNGTWEVIINAYAMQSAGFDNVDAAVAAYIAQ